MIQRHKTLCPDLESNFKPIIIQEIELAKRSKRPNLNYSSKFKELIENESFYKYIYSLLNTPCKFPSDIQVLTYYLSHSQGIINMLIEATSNIYELLTHMALEMKYEYQAPNILLFKKGDIGDKFFLIVKGRVSILIMEEKSVYLTLDEYLIYLIRLRKYHENDLLHNSLQNNVNVFDLHHCDFELWLKGLLKNSRIDFSKEFSSLVRKELDLAQKYLIENNHSEPITVEKYIKRIGVENFEDDESIIRKKVSVFSYKKIVELKDGDKFGEASIIKDVKFRTASIITMEESHFGILDKKMFDKCLSKLNERIKKNTMNYFLNNQKLFKGIDARNFSMKFLNFFILNKCGNKRIIGENEELNHIYFLKNGEYHISFRNSLIFLNEIIRDLGGINYNIREKRRMLDDEEYSKFMNEKRNFRVTILKNNDVLGLEDMLKGNSSLYNVDCNSSEGEYYIVEKKLFNSISENSKLANNNLKEFLEKKKIQMLDRLLALRESYLQIYRKNSNDIEEPIIKNAETYSERNKKRNMKPELPSLNLIKKSYLIKNKKTDLKLKFLSLSKETCFSELTSNSNLISQKYNFSTKIKFVSHNYDSAYIHEKEKIPKLKLSTNGTSTEEEIIRNTKRTNFKSKETLENEPKNSIIIAKNFHKTNVSFFPKNCCVNPGFNFIDENKEIVKTECDSNKTVSINYLKKNHEEKIYEENYLKDLTFSSPKLFKNINFDSDLWADEKNKNSEGIHFPKKNLLINIKTSLIKEKIVRIEKSEKEIR